MPPKNPFEDPRFLAGAELGRSIGRLDAYNEVKQAHEDGTLETWLEQERPKTHEEWAASRAGT